jgi:adenine deaminase
MLSVARGETPADISVVGGRVFSPATREWIETGLAIKNGFIVGWGEHEAHEIIDVRGAYITPGFIDGYVSMEYTKLWIDAFVDMVLPHGTTAVAADPYQLTSVFGIRGIEELASAADKLPFTFGIYASSFAQSSQFDSTGEHAGAVEIAKLVRDFGAIGVGGLLNQTRIISGEDDVLAKIAAARGLKVVGHAPGVVGSQLDAYLSAGIESDVACLTYEEAMEKRRKGMWVFLRSGSTRHNLTEILPVAKAFGIRNLAFSTDERELEDIFTSGHIDECLRIAVAAGLSPEDALIMASTNPAEFHGFSRLGYLSPGYQADLVILPNLTEFKPTMVFQKGTLVARSGRTMVFTVPKTSPPPWMQETIQIDLTKIGPESFSLPQPRGQVVKIISISQRGSSVREFEKEFHADDSSINRLAILGRKNLGKDVGIGLVEGIGLKEGAIASTVARGPHSLIVVGSNSANGIDDMAHAVASLIQMGGGQVVVKNKEVLASVSLPIGGIISTLGAPELREELQAVNHAAQSLGTPLSDSFRYLDLLCLAVMPELRITSLGSINVVNLIKADPLQSN